MKLRVWIQFPSMVDATQIRNESVDVEVEDVSKLHDGFWCYHDRNGKLQLAETKAESQYMFSGYQIRMIENLEYEG